MKRLPLTVLAFAALVMAATGCKNSTKSQSADSLLADSVDTVEAVITDNSLAVDSFTCRLKQGSSVTSSIYVDYPSGDDAFSQTVKAFVASQLKEVYFSRNNSMDEDKHKYPFYKGGLDTPQQMVDYYAKGVKKYLVENQKEMMSYSDGESTEVPQMEYSLEIRKVSENSKYVTYDITYTCYTGGAHGSFINYRRNISKATNVAITQLVDSTRTRALQSILRRGVVNYFRDCGETDANASNINNYLILPDESKGMIPLPVNTPYVENDSVSFIYQQYEIAPYAAGLVNFKVALKDIKPYLTKEGKAMLESVRQNARSNAAATSNNSKQSDQALPIMK